MLLMRVSLETLDLGQPSINLAASGLRRAVRVPLPLLSWSW